MKKGLSERRRCARLAALFKTLSHPQRLHILCRLCDGDSTVGDLEKACGAAQPVISQHLTRMRLEGLVESRRDGNFMYYRIADSQIPALIRGLEKILSP
jgi:ArsR family transcriptional regulator, virulence genes transcriptional regulator